MNLRLHQFELAITLLVAATFTGRVSAQEQKFHHYKLFDLGTFGGPHNHINADDFLSAYYGEAQDVNNAGTVIGWADTSTPDPYQPDFCFDAECYVAHAFQWQNGFLHDLGTLPGGASSATSWIGTNGLIAGASQNGEIDPLLPGFPEDRAVLWRNGKIIDLKTLPEGGYESGAEAVNSSGQVVGWALNTIPDPYSMALLSNLYEYYEPVYPYQTRAFLWEHGTMKDLGTLGTGTDAFAMAINEQGQIIGISYTNSTPNQVTTPCSTGPIPTQDPFLWENGKMIDLGTLGGTCGFPHWINNSGQVVGDSDLAGDAVSHPFLWTKASGMQDLGTLGGIYSNVAMINDSGVVVGGASLENGQFDAFLWNGKMHDLGSLDGCAFAWWINDEGQVVGNWGTDGCGEGGFLWENGGPMVDLNTLVSSNSGLSVQGAILINDLGEIVGAGIDANGNRNAISLIPCDENHPGIEGCDYSLVDANTTAATRVPAPVPRTTTNRRRGAANSMLRPLGRWFP